jgi:hypothetical protein
MTCGLAIAGRYFEKSTSQTKENQGNRLGLAWISLERNLDFLGFLRPSRGFSIGYGRFQERNFPSPLRRGVFW